MSRQPVHPMPDVVKPQSRDSAESHLVANSNNNAANNAANAATNASRLREANNEPLVPATPHPVLQHQVYSTLQVRNVVEPDENKEDFERLLRNEIHAFEGRLRKEVSGFQGFVSERRLVDFAVAAILGRALVSLLTSLVVDLMAPVLSIALERNLNNYYYVVRCPLLRPDCTTTTWPTVESAVASGALTINYGRFLENCFEFFIFTVVLYVTARKVINGLFFLSKRIPLLTKEVTQAPKPPGSSPPPNANAPVQTQTPAQAPPQAPAQS